MDKQELETLLQSNPALSVSSFSVGAKAHRKEELTKPFPPVSEKHENKYRNHPVYVYEDGFVYDSSEDGLGRAGVQKKKKELIAVHGAICESFDSKKEYSRYSELNFLKKKNLIKGLKRQYPLVIQSAVEYQGERLQPITYCADFVYIRDGITVVEDVKGYDAKKKRWLTTQTFDLKWKLLKAKYPDYLFELY